MPKLLLSARERILKENDQQAALEKPYAYFTLDNKLTEEDDEIANLYSFQKVFKGEFQVSVKKNGMITFSFFFTELFKM